MPISAPRQSAIVPASAAQPDLSPDLLPEPVGGAIGGAQAPPNAFRGACDHALGMGADGPPPTGVVQSSPGALRMVGASRAVEDTARILFERFDPTAPASWRRLVRRPVRHFYAPEVLHPIDWHLADVVTNGGRLYLQGAALGVGASVLAADFARAFNLRAEEVGDPRRVLYARLEPGTNTPARFFDTLGLYFRAPLRDAELTFRSPLHLALRVLQGAALDGATALIFDHVHAAPAAVRRLVGTVLRLTDPAYSVSVDRAAGGDQSLRPRIGVIVVDHLLPEGLFRAAPDVLLLLHGRHHVLQPYTTVTAVAAALRQAGIGLDTCDPDDPDDHAIASRVLEATAGLVAHMHPLLELVDAVARASGLPRPTLACVEGALQAHRPMVDVFSRPAAVPGGTLYGVYAKDAPAPPRRGGSGTRDDPGDARDVGGGPEGAAEPDAAGATAGRGRRAPAAPRANGGRTPAGAGAAGAARANATRERQLQRKGVARETAHAERRAMQRKGHVNLPDGV